LELPVSTLEATVNTANKLKEARPYVCTFDTKENIDVFSKINSEPYILRA
jgi:hypothetical protein